MAEAGWRHRRTWSISFCLNTIISMHLVVAQAPRRRRRAWRRRGWRCPPTWSTCG